MDNCTICLDTEDEDDIIKTYCGHYYHIICIQKWLESNENCPMCRAIILPRVESEGEYINNEFGNLFDDYLDELLDGYLDNLLLSELYPDIEDTVQIEDEEAQLNTSMVYPRLNNFYGQIRWIPYMGNLLVRDASIMFPNIEMPNIIAPRVSNRNDLIINNVGQNRRAERRDRNNGENRINRMNRVNNRRGR